MGKKSENIQINNLKIYNKSTPSVDRDTKEHETNIKWIKRLIEKNTGVGSGLAGSCPRWKVTGFSGHQGVTCGVWSSCRFLENMDKVLGSSSHPDGGEESQRVSGIPGVSPALSWQHTALPGQCPRDRRNPMSGCVAPVLDARVLSAQPLAWCLSLCPTS